jgi:hypothetical protein
MSTMDVGSNQSQGVGCGEWVGPEIVADIETYEGMKLLGH